MKIKIILTILNIQTIALPLLWCQRLKWGMGGPNGELLLPLCQTSRKTSFRKSEQYISFPQVTHSLSIELFLFLASFNRVFKAFSISMPVY